jgi:hypothetical protein
MLWGHGIVTTAILIMLAAILLVAAVAWHGAGTLVLDAGHWCERMSESEIHLSPAGAIAACELFLSGMKGEYGTDTDRMVPVSKAIDALRKSFETIKFFEDLRS